MIEYTKYQWVDQKHHDVFRWARNNKDITTQDNELILIYLLREYHISFTNDLFYQYQCFPEILAILKKELISQMLNQIMIINLLLF